MSSDWLVATTYKVLTASKRSSKSSAWHTPRIRTLTTLLRCADLLLSECLTAGHSWSSSPRFKPTLQIGSARSACTLQTTVTHTHHAVTETSVLACFGACESHLALLRHFQNNSDSSSCFAQNLSQPELVILKHACSSTQSKLVRVAAVSFRVVTHPLAEVIVLWFSVSTVQLGQLRRDQPATGGKRPNLSRKAALTQQKRIVVTAVYAIHTMLRTSKMRAPFSEAVRCSCELSTEEAHLSQLNQLDAFGLGMSKIEELEEQVHGRRR